uniref:Uncharacterized protein n=1 Tax=Timema tahoe TaxID=61484 RepID=A0A7R9ITY7_9NEOP|nr:unnamed protein product [Timema tahoe]
MEIGKTTLSTSDQDSNLDLPVIGSLVYHESNALDHAATKAEFRLIGVSCSAEVQLFSTLSALLKILGTGEPIKYQNRPSRISARAHLTTHELYSQKLAACFVGHCEEI